MRRRAGRDQGCSARAREGLRLCKSTIHETSPRSGAGISYFRIVLSVVPFRHLPDRLRQLRRERIRLHLPAPVSFGHARNVDPGVAPQKQVILHRNDTGVAPAAVGRLLWASSMRPATAVSAGMISSASSATPNSSAFRSGVISDFSRRYQETKCFFQSSAFLYQPAVVSLSWVPV